jgi:hypothetical protein
MAAYQFELNRPDTLRAIQMYFPQMLDSVNNIEFLLTIWEDNNGSPGNIIHQQIEKPKHTSTNNFHFYYLDSLFQLTGVFYVGWQQNTADLLNIGLDKNSYANNYMFYNVGGLWNNSQYSGAWMIRPIVSENTVFLSSNDISSSLKVYPNPASSYVKIQTNDFSNRIILFDLNGNILLNKIYNKNQIEISVDFLSSGIYVLKVINDSGYIYRKIIIR